jgi:general nucleoside transport system permease protein
MSQSSKDSARRANWIATAAGLCAAWIAFDLLVWGYGESPRELAKLLFIGTWGTSYGVGQVLFKATPILFSGLAVHLALRAGLFNIGAEGQITIASVVVAIAAAHFPEALSPVLAIPLALIIAMLAGGAWALLPGLLRARLGVHEVITTIMMNRIADGCVGLLLAVGFAEPGTVRTPLIAPGAMIARLENFVHAFNGSAVSLAIVLAVVTAFFLARWERTSRIGIELGLIGQNAQACEAEKIPVKRRIAQAMAISGAVAALAASGTVLGFKGYFEQGIGAGAGFTGIAVALLGRGSAVGLILAALLFGTLAQGGLALNAHVPKEMMDLLQAVVIVAVALADARVRNAIRAVVPKSSAPAAENPVRI